MTVSSDQVTAAYQWILGREPQPNEIPPWLTTASIAELRRIFLQSAEFRSAFESTAVGQTAAAASLPQNLAPQHVEWETDAPTSTRLLQHVERTWNKLGQERPHWSVLSADAFLPEHIARSAEAFYASGANDAARVVGALQRHGIAIPSIRRVVEYGCGIGRVTPYLARRFAAVTACDISESHLAMARDAVARSGVRNVQFQLSRPPDFGLSEPYDLWFSHIVLQHNPPPVIAMILRVAFARLAPGGIAMFQVPTYALGYSFTTPAYLAKPTDTGTIEVHCLPQEVVFRLAEEARCRPLEVREDQAMGPPSAWLSNTFIFRKYA
ncbi:MAG: class I SAM-dependent methyltransferase [Planctomycetia bacterium]|jgi:SAM-dependent methyltransferase